MRKLTQACAAKWFQLVQISRCHEIRRCVERFFLKQFWPGVLPASVISAMARAVTCHAQNVPVHTHGGKRYLY